MGGHPGLTGDAITDIVNAMKYGWLESSMSRIEEQYGIIGTGMDLGMHIYNDEPFGVLGLIAYSYDGTGVAQTADFYIDAADFHPHTWPEGDVEHLSEAGLQYCAPRITAHEMVHATMAVNMDFRDDNVDYWFKEGTAEFIHGRAEAYVTDYEADRAAIVSYIDTARTTKDHFPPANASYSGGYVMTWHLHDAVKTAGGNGIRDIMDDLKSGTSLEDAILARTGQSTADLFANAGAIVDNYYNKLKTDTTGDTGAIGGYLVDNGDVLTADKVIDANTASNFSGQPIADYGWNVVWPTDMSNFADTPTFYSHNSLASTAGTVEGTYHSIGGTIVAHSAVAGSSGDLTFSGDESLLKALGFAEVKASRETEYIVSVNDAHDGQPVTPRTRYSGENLRALLGPNVDVQLGVNAGLDVRWDDDRVGFTFTGGMENRHDFRVHLVDSAISLHIGANSGQNVTLGIGNLSSSALGIDRVTVQDMDRAQHSIALLDRAISQVSSQRGKLGSMQNRLDHSINSLNVAFESLQASESRIRDVNVSKEMTRLVTAQMLSQAGTSMLGHANAMPHMVMQLLQ
ncbi:flagellin [Desulfurispira natronophila]|uniref:Flagellin-like hook-associated protein FlgL n=1 Tax=Desulfurispira natronophila TaxID=682562 RepID=A0A7W7Y660_9BACT|nr:flagellin [Desulfurispira natronophila]MBB5022826.1 flagellin-like hook-associated protein FlgL [Desulfurispira natronophila]